MDHDHGMGGMSPTTTMSMGAESTAAADDMDMGMGMGGGCKISMLLNYNTVGTCFISDDWQITSTGMFAGSCIGVVLLCVLLEFLRRSVKELDRFLLKQHYASHASATAATPASGAENGSKDKDAACVVSYPPFRPNIWQQALRALLHTAQFTVAYFIMLLAMYYNVYILVSIFLGVLVGSFIFQWETLSFGSAQNSGGREPTVCCG